MTRLPWPLVPLPKPAPRPRRKGRKDPVTPELREYVLRRDGGCVAPVACDCEASRSCSGRLTIDHVKDEPRLGVRAPSDARHCATLCERHHLDTGWATAHRPHLREYLRHQGSRMRQSGV